MQQFDSLRSILECDVEIYYVQGASEFPAGEMPSAEGVHLLKAPCGDCYEDITFKLWYGFSYLRYFYDVVLKIDENLVVRDAVRLVEIIMEEVQFHPYGAVKGIGHYTQPSLALEHGYKVNNPLFRSTPAFFPPMRYAGSSYYLRKDALMLLTKKDFSCFIAEDYAVGYFLKTRYGIDVYPSRAITEAIFVDRQGFDKPPLAPTVLAPSGTEEYYKMVWSLVPEDPILAVHVHGGLGNQLFQVAVGVTLAIEYGMKLQLVTKSSYANLRPYYWDSVLVQFAPNVVSPEQLCERLKAESRWNVVEYRELAFRYDKIPLHKSHCILWGYFQSEKYFKLISHDVRKMLALPSVPDLPQNIVVVHARRGDYLTIPEFHRPLDDDYYRRAVALMKERVRELHSTDPLFILFSDDPEYWATTSVFKDEQHSIWADKDEIHTFSFMIGAKNFIIANSTFSWWAAKLSGSHNIIAPKQWFGPKGPQDTEDLYTEHMTVI